MFYRELKWGIRVKVRSLDILGEALPEDVWAEIASGRPLVVEVEPGTSVGELFGKLSWLGRPLGKAIVVFVNGKQQALDYVLQPEDVIDLVIPVAGG